MTDAGELPEPPLLDVSPEPEPAALDDDGSGDFIGLAEVTAETAGTTAFSLLPTGMLGVVLVATGADMAPASEEAAVVVSLVSVAPPPAAGEPPSTWVAAPQEDGGWMTAGCAV